MPEFLEEFASEIERKKEHFRQLLSNGVSSALDADLGRLMRENWHCLEGLDLASGEGPPRAIAVDGSMASRVLANGSILYIVRSLAICGRRRFRCLESDVLVSKSDVKTITDYVNHRSQWLEHKVASEALKAEEECRFLLIDGSLHGRLMAIPRDMPHEGQRGFMIEYFREYYELLEACRRRNVIPVGISKDSRATLLRDYFLKVLLDEELRRLALSAEDEEKIRKIFSSILRREKGQQIRSLRALEVTYGIGSLDRIVEILLEAKALRCDHQMIMNLTRSEGYSTPLELGAFGGGAMLLDSYLREPQEYVRTHFPEAIDESGDPERFIDESSVVLSKIPFLPTIVSFHALLDKRDTPIRIDVPSWVFGIDRCLNDLRGFSAVDQVNVERVLSMLMLLFGGISHYNVLLTAVDSEVRLKHGTVDRIYLPMLEKVLKIPYPLRHMRGYRRGWYAR